VCRGHARRRCDGAGRHLGHGHQNDRTRPRVDSGWPGGHRPVGVAPPDRGCDRTALRVAPAQGQHHRRHRHYRTVASARRRGGSHPRCAHDVQLQGAEGYSHGHDDPHPSLQMTMTSRRGFTLVELIITLVLMLMVAGVTYGLLVNNQRVSRAQTSQVSLQDNVRSGALILGNELRELGYDEVTAASAASVAQVPGLIPGNNSDLIAIGPDSIRYRAMRALGFTCSLDPANGEIVVRNANFQQQRAPALTDRLMLYVENDPKTSGDDTWLHANITSLPGGQNCPDGTAGTRLRVTFDAALAATVLNPAHTLVGGPIRIYEVMLLRSYALSGQTWLGTRSISANSAIEPVLGPLSSGAGAA